MKHRKLRITWSVAWGIVAVLLLAMWLRSHWKSDNFYNSRITVGSTTGEFQFGVFWTPNQRKPLWTSLPARKDIFISPIFCFRPDEDLSYLNAPYWFLTLIFSIFGRSLMVTVAFQPPHSANRHNSCCIRPRPDRIDALVRLLPHPSQPIARTIAIGGRPHRLGVFLTATLFRNQF